MDEEYKIIEYDTYTILEELKNEYKNLTGNILADANPRMIDYQVIAYKISNILKNMDDAIKQNYLRYARDERLDLKGEFWGERGERIGEGTATTTMRCYIQGIKDRDIVIPEGTRFIKDDYIFKSISEERIKKGFLYCDVIVESVTSGYIQEYEIGEITEIIDKYDYYEKVENISKITGGNDIEDDERYRERLYEVSESFTTAGSEASYLFWTKTLCKEAESIKIISPKPCYINIYLCDKNGNDISIEAKNDLQQKITPYIPLGDKIEIKNPERVDFNIDITIFLQKSDESIAQDKIELSNTLINNYLENITTKIGIDINPQDLITILKNSGIRRIEVREPIYINLADTQIARCISKNIVYGGVED